MLYFALKDSDSQHNLCIGLSFIANIQSLNFQAQSNEGAGGKKAVPFGRGQVNEQGRVGGLQASSSVLPLLPFHMLSCTSTLQDKTYPFPGATWFIKLQPSCSEFYTFFWK